MVAPGCKQRASQAVVGDEVGEEVGLTVGDVVAVVDGSILGSSLGSRLGVDDGRDVVGDAEGVELGSTLGEALGIAEGDDVGELEGDFVDFFCSFRSWWKLVSMSAVSGRRVGSLVGDAVGNRRGPPYLWPCTRIVRLFCHGCDVLGIKRIRAAMQAPWMVKLNGGDIFVYSIYAIVYAVFSFWKFCEE